MIKSTIVIPLLAESVIAPSFPIRGIVDQYPLNPFIAQLLRISIRWLTTGQPDPTNGNVLIDASAKIE
jgi:hypothetical protein